MIEAEIKKRIVPENLTPNDLDFMFAKSDGSKQTTHNSMINLTNSEFVFVEQKTSKSNTKFSWANKLKSKKTLRRKTKPSEN